MKTLFSVTMTLNSKISVIAIYSDIKMGRFESSHFDLRLVNFDTMKLILYAKVLESLLAQWFSNIEKERKLQYQWYHNFRSYLVRVTGLEPARGNTRS